MLVKKRDIQQVANEMMNMLHQEEIDIINNFHDAVLAKDINKITELFEVVIFDIEDHFSTEEDMMQENKYVNFQVHKSDHDSMRKKVYNMQKQWQKSKDPIEVQDFLENEFKIWLVMHISKWDAETALHLGHAN